MNLRAFRAWSLFTLLLCCLPLWAADDAPYWHENPISRPVGTVQQLTALQMPQAPGHEIAAWQQALAVQMGRYDTNPIRPRPVYQHARIYLGWDADTLYLAAEVYDPEQINQGEGESLWDGDCVQIAVAKDHVWQEFAFALTHRGPETFCWQLAPHKDTEYVYLGKRTLTDVQAQVVRDDTRTLYFAALPTSELRCGPLRAGDHLRFNIAVFDRTPAGTRINDVVELAPGIVGPKYLAPFARLTLVSEAKAMTPVVASTAGLVPNPSFEIGTDAPAGWQARTSKGGVAEWARDGSSGRRSLRFAVSAQPDAAQWVLNEPVSLKPNTAYTLSVRSKGNGKANFFRLILNTGQKVHILGLSPQPQWSTASMTFASGDSNSATLYIESCNWQGQGTSEVYVDDVLLTEGGIQDSEITKREVAYLSDDLTASTAFSFKALYPQRIKFFDITQPLPWEEITTFEKLVFLPGRTESFAGFNWSPLRAYAEAGRPVVMDLAAYAAMMEHTVVDANLPEQSPWKTFLQREGKNKLPKEVWQEAARAEDGVPIPLAVVKTACELSQGYPIGSEIPWFGRANGQFVQRSLVNYTPKSGETVVAVSSVNGGPVWLTMPMGKGSIAALDLRSLNEPTGQWGDRGSYNKYAPVQNALGHGLRYGVYWNRRLDYYAYLEKLRELTKEYPALQWTVEGFSNGFNRYGICIGNPKAPIYLYTGMMHAKDEYRSGMYGLYAFARYLGRHAHESPWKERLQKIGVKIIPVVAPELYVGHNTFANIGKETPLPLTQWSGEIDNIRLVHQQHHGAGPLHVLLCSSMHRGGKWGRAIHDYALQEIYATAPSVFWDTMDQMSNGPKPINAPSWTGECHESWNPSMYQLTYYSGLKSVTEERLKLIKFGTFAEHTTYGLCPGNWDQDKKYMLYEAVEREYHSALMSDQTVAFMLAELLVEPIDD
jgi:hypothetical protein